MPTWNANQYLKFVEERTRPCRDLLAGIALPRVRRVIDLGCGPGNSTSVLAERWPQADITGLDSAVSMIDVARREQPQHRWMVGDISEWAANETERFDIVFSNAALHWLPDHATLSGYYNLDNGTGAIRGIYLQGNAAAAPIFSSWMEPFREWGMATAAVRSTGGTDHVSFDAIGRISSAPVAESSRAPKPN